LTKMYQRLIIGKKIERLVGKHGGVDWKLSEMYWIFRYVNFCGHGNSIIWSVI